MQACANSLPSCLSQENQEPGHARKGLLKWAEPDDSTLSTGLIAVTAKTGWLSMEKSISDGTFCRFILHLGQDLCRGSLERTKPQAWASCRLRSETRELIHQICFSDKHHVPLAYMVLDRFTSLDPTPRPLGKRV